MTLREIVQKCFPILFFFLSFYTIQAQSGLVDIDLKVINPSACNQLDGEIHITPLDGTSPYEYSINGGASFQSDSLFMELGIGTYIILVRDSQYRFSSFELTRLVAEGAPIIKGIVMSNPRQCGIGGTLKILAEGGIPPLQYSIDNGTTFQDEFLFEDVQEGIYEIAVRNSDSSCVASYPTISFAPESPINLIDIQVVTEQPSCDSLDGHILVEVTGGSGDYRYSIDNGVNYQAENTFENLGEGTYNILIQDTLLNCEKEANQVVVLDSENCVNCDSLLIEIFKTSPNCDSLNGQIVVATSGNSGGFKYSIDGGQNFQDSPIFFGLGEGNYLITVRDTIYQCDKNGENVVSLLPFDCPNCDSLEIQTFINIPNCDSLNGQIELTISGGSGNYQISLNGGEFQTSSIFTNLGEGAYTVIVKDTTRDCEKSTFSPINLIAEGCNCSLNIFEEAPITVMLESCDDTATVCLDVALESIMVYEILDNGVSYNGGLMGCDFDTMLTYLYFTLPGQGFVGPYHLDRWEVNDSVYTGDFQDINELVLMMNALDTLTTWTRDSVTMTLKGGFPGTEYGALEITQVGTNMKGVFQLNTNYLPMGSQIALGRGMHELIFRDRTSKCTDTLNVNVECMTCPIINLISQNTQKVSNCDTSLQFCFEGISGADLSIFNILDNGAIYSGKIGICDSMETGFSLTLDTGSHQIIIENMELGCQFIYNLTVDCQLNTINIDTIVELGQIDTICFQDLFMEDSVISIRPTCEGQNPAVGFEINNLTNCLIYEGNQIGKDTICIEVCLDNNTCEEVIITVTVIDSICQDLLGAGTTVELDDCDSSGLYCLNILKSDLPQYNLSINGANYTGSFVDCDLPEHASIELVLGVYEIVLTTLDGRCSDTATVNVICEPETNEFMDTVMVNMTDTFCVDSSEFAGNLVSIKNICEEQSGEFVIFIIDTLNFCLSYEGVEEGVETACIEVCDDLGTCDTTMIIISVEPEPDTIPFPIAINDFDTLKEGETRTLNVLGNDTTNSTLITVTIIDQPIHGNAVVNADMTITYMPNDTICDVTDIFTYELCNPRGCDTATVELYIDCKEFIIFNGFSPNKDGINETFMIEGIEDFPNNTLMILNRWGNKVFEQSGYKGQWDGTWKNNKLPSGTYFYLLDDGEGKKYSGFLQLER